MLISCDKYGPGRVYSHSNYRIPVMVNLHSEAYTYVKMSSYSDERVVLRSGKLTTLDPSREAVS